MLPAMPSRLLISYILAGFGEVPLLVSTLPICPTSIAGMKRFWRAQRFKRRLQSSTALFRRLRELQPTQPQIDQC